MPTQLISGTVDVQREAAAHARPRHLGWRTHPFPHSRPLFHPSHSAAVALTDWVLSECLREGRRPEHLDAVGVVEEGVARGAEGPRRDESRVEQLE